MEKIKIYTNETCPYCKQIKETLNEANVEFQEVKTKDAKEEWQDIVNLIGTSTVPTINYCKEYFVAGRDYQNPHHLINILKDTKVSKFKNTQKTYERLKTLNFHVHTAFGRLDKLLRQIETKINTDEHESTD